MVHVASDFLCLLSDQTSLLLHIVHRFQQAIANDIQN